MRKVLLSICTIITAAVAFGQSSDDPIYNSQVQGMKEEFLSNKPVSYQKSANILSLPCDSGSATLVSSCGGMWYSDSAGTNLIAATDTLITGTLNSDTTFYVSGNVALTPTVGAPLPNHSSTFSGNVRGYYFTSPADIYIDGLWVPTEASTGNQHVTIVRFNNNTPPPLWSSTTNDFTVLGEWQNYSAMDTIPACIVVDSGDVIGIYGNRNDMNSYAGAPYNSTIAGIPTTFTRSGMQLPLGSNTLQNVFSETGGSISRVEFFYTDSFSTGGINPVNVNLPQSTNDILDIALCPGDTYFAGGALQDSTGTWIDSLTSMNGCDSIVTVNLTLRDDYSLIDSINVCPGDSILINGAYVSTPGFYVDPLQSIYGCDSTVTKVVSFDAPNSSTTQNGVDLMADLAGASYQWIDCDNGNSAIAGATSQTYTATANGNYAVIVTENGCSDTSSCMAVTTVGILENTFGENLRLFPNPTAGKLTIDMGSSHGKLEVVVTDVIGKIVDASTVTDAQTIDMTLRGANGYYLITVRDYAGHQAQFRVIKH